MTVQRGFHRGTYAVWELTLKCNLACSHCGSRAGDAREHELTTAEALDLVEQLAEVGISEVTLIGGEAFLRRDWLEIATAITRAGMDCNLTTGGYGISAATVRRMREAGISRASISIDGLEDVHDQLRGRRGSWQSCFNTMRLLREAGMAANCNTQINRLTAPQMPALHQLLHAAGANAWQVQLTVALGNAADRPELLLQPYDLLEVFPMLARIAEDGRAGRGPILIPGNNVGYYGPYERVLRSEESGLGMWSGCQAGLNTLGIEADGIIKGCPSLPTASYAGANIRERRLRDIIAGADALQLNTHAQSNNPAWGFCATCDYSRLCRGGCIWTAHALFNRRGNNPMCHHRALVHHRQGLRERLVQTRPAPGLPFDHGEFELIVEPIPEG